MAAAEILDSKNCKFLTVWHAEKVELLHSAKFRINRSNRGRDMVFFDFFKDEGRRHLRFLKFQIFNGLNSQEALQRQL